MRITFLKKIFNVFGYLKKYAIILTRLTNSDNMRNFPLRKLTLLPVIVAGIITFYQFFVGNALQTWLYLGATLFLLAIFYPVFSKADEKEIPMLHIVVSLLIFLAIFFLAFQSEFVRIGFGQKKAFIFAFFLSFVSIGTIMVLKGSK